MTRVEIPFKMNLPQEVFEINKIFKDNNFDLFVVGGAVRDAFKEEQPKDFDLATNATPDEIVKIMSEAGFYLKKTGVAFGIVNVFVNDIEFEVATFRTDIGSGRRPDSVEFTTIENDVLRRDLTINALFYNIETETIIDLVGGIQDLKDNVIRTVGDPFERFTEDKLRVMRVVRFAARMDARIHTETFSALEKNSSLEGVAQERIIDEFIKGMTSAKDQRLFIHWLRIFGLTKYLFGDLKVMNLTYTMQRFNENIDEVIFTLMKFNESKKVKKVLTEKKFTTKTINMVVFFIDLQRITMDDVLKFKEKQNRFHITNEELLKIGSNVDSPNNDLIIALTKFEFSVDGKSLMESTGLGQGKELGDLIAEMELDNFKKIYGETLI